MALKFQCSYHRKCQRRGKGGQKKPKFCQHSMWTTFKVQIWPMIIRGHSCTSLVSPMGAVTDYVDKILAFLTTYPPALTFSMVWTLTKRGHFWTTYLPRLVNVVCERPLIKKKAQFLLQNLKKYIYFDYTGATNVLSEIISSHSALRALCRPVNLILLPESRSKWKGQMLRSALWV